MSSNTSFPSSVLFREIHKNAWLRKLPYHNEKKGGALSKVRYIIFFNALYLLIGKSLYVRHLVGKLGYYFLNWNWPLLIGLLLYTRPILYPNKLVDQFLRYIFPNI